MLPIASLLNGAYDVGDVISDDDQNMEFSYCYPSDSTGSTFRLNKYSGKVIMLERSASWWAPCFNSIPEGEEIFAKWENDNRVAIIHFLDDINQPYSCSQWGDYGTVDIPLIVDDGDGYTVFDWFENPNEGESIASLILFIDHTMKIVNIMSSSPSLIMANFIIENMLEHLPENEIEGCTYPDACNYDPDAIEDDGSCVYPEENYNCAGDCTAGVDCAGQCGGNAFVDACGICGGNNSSCADCNGVLNGYAILDNCGNCVEGNIGLTACIQDCAGVWGGSLVSDACGICGGTIINELDCVCPGGSPMDCAGVCGGTTVQDECGICGGGNTTCADCADIPNGISIINNCSDCVIEGDSADILCKQGCDGIWHNDGSHLINDECGICGGSGIPDGYCDCKGNVLDVCGVCGGGGPNLGHDCEGNPLSIYNGIILDKFDITSIYPNPFNPMINIEYELSVPASIQFEIYNINGQQIDIMNEGYKFPGIYSAVWNGENYPSGMYFITLNNGSILLIKKMILLKWSMLHNVIKYHLNINTLI